MDLNIFSKLDENLINLVEKVKSADLIELNDNEKFDQNIVSEWKKLVINEENDRLENVIKSSIETLNSRIENLLYDFDYIIENNKDSFLQQFDSIFIEIKEEVSRTEYLKILGKHNLVIVGSNGSGKSAFSSYIKKSLSNSVLVIPAQKFLYYNKSDREMPLIDRQKFLTIQQQNYNEKRIFDDQYNNGYTTRFDGLSIIFQALISLTVNEYIDAIHRREEGKEENCSIVENCNYNTLKILWEKLIPDIYWELDTINRTLTPNKNGQPYNINDMSDGEKAVIFYLLSILNAEENSYIIVDEPETYLNPSIYKRLWDLLEDARKDCIFIYISHNVDFISTRYNHDLYWCKSYDGSTYWDIQKIDKKYEQLPKHLLIELLGAQVPIIFCEGEKLSLDYKIYSSLFEGKAVIIPANGHKTVVSYTKSYNKIPNSINKAFGIIDKDFHNEEKLNKYAKDGIFGLYFNEIEMFLICEEIIEAVINKKDKDGILKKSDFIKNFFKELEKRKKDIVDMRIKSIADDFLESERVESYCTDEILKKLEGRLNKLELEEKRYEYKSDLDRIIQEKNYEEALKICNYKGVLKMQAKYLA